MQRRGNRSMDNQQDSDLNQRVEQLEAVVVELQQAIRQLHNALARDDSNILAEELNPSLVPESDMNGLSDAHPLPQGAAEHEAAPRPRSELQSTRRTPAPVAPVAAPFDWLQNGEFLLNRIGISLLLLGVIFLFKYSIEQGWLTPVVRIGFGFALAMVLLVIGLRLRRSRQSFSPVLLGGSIATFYITGFAAYQLYALIAYPIALVFMVSVTLLAFFLSMHQNQSVLSVIGAAGGLGTPFLLYRGAGSLVGLVGYTGLILAGTSAIYFRQGWRSLLWTTFLGSWAVFLIGYTRGFSSDGDRWALQLGILFAWLAFSALPVIREVLWMRHPERWPHPLLNPAAGPPSTNVRNLISRSVHLLSVLTPLIALGFSTGVWSLSEQTWGWIAIAGAILYGVVSWYLRLWHLSRQLANTHTLVVFLLLTLALVLLLEGDALFLMLAAEAAVLHWLANRLLDRAIATTAHLLFVSVGIWLAVRLVSGVEGTALFNAQALTDLVVIVLGFAASIAWRSQHTVWIYRGLAHIAFLGWLWREFSVLHDGNGYVTIAWGVYAVILLLLGLRRDLHQLRVAALGTLLLVVVKLFLFDLQQLKAIWRILLFLGFGGLFLVLSYYFRALWRPTSKPTNRSD